MGQLSLIGTSEADCPEAPNTAITKGLLALHDPPWATMVIDGRQAHLVGCATTSRALPLSLLWGVYPLSEDLS